VLDRWIRSRLHSTTAAVTNALEGFDALRGAQTLERFVDDLSNWYVRRSRSRFWNAPHFRSGTEPASRSGTEPVQEHDGEAHATLHECLSTVALLLAPFCPFVADELHRNLARSPESVHLADWPRADPSALDADLEAEMDRARTVVSLGLAARNEAKLKVRQPLRRALVLLPEGRQFSEPVGHEVADALNVKLLEPVTDLEGLLTYTVVPNFRSLGPKVGERMPLVKAALLSADAAAVRHALAEQGTYELLLGDGTTVALDADDVDVRAASHEELALAQDGGFAVALDTAIDDELRAEGMARDAIRLVNDRRKALGFEIADRVRLRIGAHGRIGAAVHRHRDWIANEVLAVELHVGLYEEITDDGSIEIDGDPITLDIAPA